MCTKLFMVALFVTTESSKLPECPSTEDQLNKLWHTYAMEY